MTNLNPALNSANPTDISNQISEVIKYLIVSLSLLLTGLFFFENGGFVLASMLVLAQLYVTINIPSKLSESIKNKSLGKSFFNAALLTIVLGFSIAGSFFFLTKSTHSNVAILKQREVIQTQIDLKLESAKKLVERDFITRSKPLYAEIKSLQNELKELPVPNGLDTLFISIFGSEKGILFFNVFMILASLVVDLIAMIAFSSNKNEVAQKSTEVTNEKEIGVESKPISPKPDGNDNPPKKTAKKAEKKTESSNENIFSFSTNPDVNKVIKAYKTGEIDRIVVKTVQPLLNRNQTYASEITKEAKRLIGKIEAA